MAPSENNKNCHPNVMPFSVNGADAAALLLLLLLLFKYFV
jgi:hypothetical protein